MTHTGDYSCGSLVNEVSYLGTNPLCEVVDTNTIRFYYSTDAPLGNEITFTTNFNLTIIGSFIHNGPLPTASISYASSFTDAEDWELALILNDPGT